MGKSSKAIQELMTLKDCLLQPINLELLKKLGDDSMIGDASLSIVQLKLDLILLSSTKDKSFQGYHQKTFHSCFQSPLWSRSRQFSKLPPQVAESPGNCSTLSHNTLGS
jgi:hypothetical protein